MVTPLADALLDRLNGHPADLVVEDDDESLTARQLGALIEHQADVLAVARVRPGEPVVLACSNRAADIAGFLAIWSRGAVVVPVHRGTTEAALKQLYSTTGARLTVNGCPDLPTCLPRKLISVQGDPPKHRPLLDGAATVVFTSGSTGEPKGVVIGRDRLAAKLGAIDQALEFDAEARTLLTLQLTFIFGQWVSFLTLLKGGYLIMRSRFRAPDVLDDLNVHGISHFAAVPTMLRAMVPSLAGRLAYAGHVMSGGEILPGAVACSIRQAWPEVKLWDLYGSTETSACDFIVRPDEFPDASGTIGRPMPGIDYRLDPEGGELEIHSPYRMLGYLDRPDLTAEVFRGDWFRTGDSAERRADDLVALTGRLKDLINRGGNKISPVEIERVVERHPDIEAAMAVGIPDPMIGEALHLFLVFRGGAMLSPEAIRAWLALRLERFKLPDRIHVGSSLPIGATGKTDRRAFREMIAAAERATPGS